MTDDVTTKSKATKNKNAVLPKQATGITGKKFLKITIFFFITFLIIGSVYIIVSKLHGKTTISGFQWCKSGNTLKLEDAILTAVGLEDYKSPQYEDKVCHLTYIIDNISSELYLDEIALVNFNNKEKDRGNGCMVYRDDKTQRNNELCFGSKVKETSKTQKSSVGNLTGTKWRYTIQVGGGVGGAMTFEKDEGGSLAGSFTEYGPEGKKEKRFIGSYEKDNFLLTLEEFPTFKIELSPDSQTMTGKPVEQSKDIFYPDDFFKATLESQENISPASSWKTLTNDKMGITIVYPDLFRYGLEESKTEEMIQIASYDLNKDYGLEFPPGIKLEIVKEANTNNLSLLEWAGQHSEGVGGSLGFEETQIGGLSGLKRYVQENNLSTLTIIAARGKYVYTIYLIGKSAEYNLHKGLLEEMLGKLKFI